MYTNLLFSCQVMSDSLWPSGLQHARLPCPSPCSRVCSNSCPLSQWYHPTISSSVSPFSCPQSFPSSGSFLMIRSSHQVAKVLELQLGISPSSEYEVKWSESHSAVSDSLRSHGSSVQGILQESHEYWSGFPFPSPGDLPNSGIEPRCPTLQVDSLTSEPQGKPKNTGSLALLQGIFLTQDSNQGLLHCRQILYHLSYQGNPMNIQDWFPLGLTGLISFLSKGLSPLHNILSTFSILVVWVWVDLSK